MKNNFFLLFLPHLDSHLNSFRVLAVKESIKAKYKICPKGNKN